MFQLFVESILKLEVAYYNERISVWEPLVEPVLDSGKLRKWELQLEVRCKLGECGIYNWRYAVDWVNVGSTTGGTL
ncbi:hypothetical protein DPMN_029099 [Dreissena polymorpha]|uniref:Uncharacterized protein n=1 Tax=Dreissena polymorpha TaxID=45954 RepID=A0A9D4LWK4_DREPO|nr:hypothetical protein DPMN_029099 [Dreissena polymorpha]